ncbi:MAG: glycoside hydrolase family 127 protein [Aeoliella sp.]
MQDSASKLRHWLAVSLAALFFSHGWATAAEDVGNATSDAVADADYPLKPVPFNEVTITSEFWRPRLVTQRETLVPFAFERTRPGVAHLQAAADHLAGKEVSGHRAHRFIDSDLYKVMEGAAYLLQLRHDPELETTLDELADVIAAAQHEDGYLYPSHTTGVGKSQNMMGDEPYTFVVHSHELYNVGHLYEAAIAYYRATGNDKLLKVAEKSAEHLNRVLFEGDPKYNGGKPVLQAPGHEEIELALVKLFRITGKPLYLDMARKLLEIRGVSYVPEGEGVMAPTYAQQHAPVLQQREAVGHAVRATYLYSAMADVGTLTNQPAYRKALDHIWRNIVDTRMHITGGLGAVHGIEGFGPRYLLPNKDAFNETCAAVGNVLFNYRMFLLNKDAKYLDVAEVALLNNVLAAVNFEGNRFFYVNPLAADGKYPFNHGTACRAPWFGTACCPSNMARLVPQVPGMTYAHDDDNIFVTFYAGSKTTVELAKAKVSLIQQTTYPNDGLIELEVSPNVAARFRLLLRIPTWTRDRFVPGELYHYADGAEQPVELFVNGESLDFSLENGFAVVDREWHSGDRVQLELPMPLRISDCHSSVAANRDRIAFTRGPMVMCAEGVDNSGATQRLYFEQAPAASATKVSTTTIESGSFVQATVPGRAVTEDEGAENVQVALTPYYAWNNRGVSSMTVWFPRNRDLAVFDPTELPEESPFAEVNASHTFVDDTISAIGDNKEPRHSTGKKVTRWSSRPQKDQPQWIEGRFPKTRHVRSIGVYWFDDQKDVRIPAEWSMEVEQDGQWKPFELYVTDEYGLRVNQYNVVHPASELNCDAIRIQMTPQEDACVGILEIDVVLEEDHVALKK